MRVWWSVLALATACARSADDATLEIRGVDSESNSSSVAIHRGGGAQRPGVPWTKVIVGQSVWVRDVVRLGLNIPAEDQWGAARMSKNLLPNPGFEPGIHRTVWLSANDSTSGRFRPEFWTVSNGGHGPGFWDGAEFELVYGPGAPASGTVRAFRHVNGRYEFELGAGMTPLHRFDVLFTRQLIDGARGANGRVGTPDRVAPYSGVQSLRLAPADAFDYYMDSAWRDGDQSSGKLFVVEGVWRVRLKARAAVAGDRIRVRFVRDGGPATPVFLDRTFVLGTSWASHDETQTIAPGVDANPPTWPPRVARPILAYQVRVLPTNRGPVWIDELELYRVDDASNPTAFSDRFVQRLRELQPGVLRSWTGHLSDSVDNATRPWQTRSPVGHRPSDASTSGWRLGLNDLLALCREVGAEPWYVLPPTLSRGELHDLVEYLAGNHGRFAQRRIDQGQVAPWTDVFERIRLEFGNELWGSGEPGDPMTGASVRGGERLGRIASDRFAILKQSPWYPAVADRLDLSIGGQQGYPPRQREIDLSSLHHDAIGITGYFGGSSDWTTDADLFGALFARPFFEALHPLGRIRQGWENARGSYREPRMAVYEVNYHVTSPGTIPQLLRHQMVAGASGAVVLPLTMLVYLRELGFVDQCAFNALQYSFRFQSTGTQDDYVKLWGLLRDLHATGRKRPTWLGLEVANHAISGDMITTSHGGDDPTWTQPPRNGVPVPMTVGLVQSFAFRDGDRLGLVLFNLDLSNPQVVRLVLPSTPRSIADVWAVEPASIRDTNEDAENVAIHYRQLTDFADDYDLTLPPHSVRAVVWRRAP